jgi:hypothetical protein
VPLTPRARAYLFRVTPQTAESDWTSKPADALEVQFNPTTLGYTLQNTLDKRGRDAKAAQYVSQSSAKLEFDLLFDGTHDGRDVRTATRTLRDFLQPQADQNDAPPVVGFAWGTFRFKGVAESFRETLDYFSTEGVPLRSTVKLTLAAQNARDIFGQEDLDRLTAAGLDADVQLVPVPASGVNRAEAARNGFENMRNPSATLAAAAGSGPTLKAAAGFAASASAGGGFSLGASAGAGIGASAGAGIGGGGGFGLGVSVGGGASAGVSAAQGAFDGLRASRASARATPTLVLPALAPLAARPAASGEFALGGASLSSSASGLRADVGITARIRFD